MCGYDDPDELCPVHSMAWHRSRKLRPCSACKRTIERGELYHKSSVLFDSSWRVVANCARCWAIVEHLWDVRPDAYIALRLDCGEAYEAPDDDPGHALAFMTDAEAQAWAMEQRRNTHAGGGWSI